VDQSQGAAETRSLAHRYDARVKPWIPLLFAPACGSTTPKPAPAVVLAGWAAPDPARVVWVVGFAQQAKLGAIVQAGDVPVTCTDQHEWPEELLGRLVVVAGTLSARTHPRSQSFRCPSRSSRRGSFAACASRAFAAYASRAMERSAARSSC